MQIFSEMVKIRISYYSSVWFCRPGKDNFLKNSLNLELFLYTTHLADIWKENIAKRKCSAHPAERYTFSSLVCIIYMLYSLVLCYAMLLLSCPTLCDPVDYGLLCPWDSPGKNTGVSCHALLQGIFPTQGSNLRLWDYKLHKQEIGIKGRKSTPLFTHCKQAIRWFKSQNSLPR